MNSRSNTPIQGPKVDHRGADIDHARHDPAIALASIFRPVSRGVRPKLNVKTEHGGVSLTFVCYDALDSRDQSVLLASVGLAGLIGKALAPEPNGDTGRQLWLDLQPQESAKQESCIVFTTTHYALLEAAGMAVDGKSYKRLKDILFRLSQVGVRANKDGWDWSMRLLSYAAGPDGTVHIALNSRFAQAIAGHHVRVDLTERRQLSGDTTQVLHAWLIAATRPGRSLDAVKLDTLAERVWGGPASNENTKRYRRKLINSALVEIGNLDGWTVLITGSGKTSRARIKRGNTQSIT